MLGEELVSKCHKFFEPFNSGTQLNSVQLIRLASINASDFRSFNLTASEVKKIIDQILFVGGDCRPDLINSVFSALVALWTEEESVEMVIWDNAKGDVWLSESSFIKV